MKKVLICLLAVVAMFACTLSVSAEADFVKSITDKGAPDVVGDDDGSIGGILGDDGEVIHMCHEDHIVITPVAEAETSTEIPEDAKELLQQVYGELCDSDAKLSEIFDDLNDDVKAALGEDKDADDLVIRDLFDITGICSELKALPKDGQSIELTFDLSVGKDILVLGMIYYDGEWKQLDLTNNGDGTVSVMFTELCPVAFLVPGSAANAPTTGEDLGKLAVWGGLLAVSAVAIVLLVVFGRKKGQN